jgi:hypothetical protein
MSGLRLLGVVAAAALVASAAGGCATTVDGRGTLANGVVTPGTTRSGSPAGSPGPTRSPSPTHPPSPSRSPTPTVDPVKTKERVTCVLVQATIKTTNDKFNAARSRELQIKVLKSAVASIDRTLRQSGLTDSSLVYRTGRAILLELRKIVGSAERGGNPSTTPYNTLTTRFRTACLNI